MFKLIWIKIATALSALLVVVGYYAKYLSKKNDKLENKLKVKDKLDDIREQQDKAKEEILNDEAKTIKHKIKPTNNRRERIKRMRNNNTRT